MITDKLVGALGVHRVRLFADRSESRTINGRRFEDWYKGCNGSRGEDEVMEERSGSNRCPRCRHDNPLENRFCGACGASLTVGEQLARRPEGSPVTPSRALLPAELKPVGRALAVGLATLAAQAGLAWLRRRVEGPGRPSLPAAGGTKPVLPQNPVYQSFEEVHAWLREGEIESRIFAQRAVTYFRSTDHTGERRGGS
jgi:hypothetical protein